MSTASDGGSVQWWSRVVWTASDGVADKDMLDSLISHLCPTCGLWLVGVDGCECNHVWLRPEDYDSGEELDQHNMATRLRRAARHAAAACDARALS